MMETGRGFSFVPGFYLYLFPIICLLRFFGLWRLGVQMVLSDLGS